MDNSKASTQVKCELVINQTTIFIEYIMSEIKLTGVITRILAAKEGTSQRTGKPWKKQGYVIQHENGQYPRSCRFDVMGEEKIAAFDLVEGETVTVHLDIDAREYGGNWYNDINAWKVERPQAQQPVQAPYAPSQPVPQPQQATMQPLPFDAPQQPAAQSYVYPEPQSDEAPF